ncbi:ankyrin repeat domain-containing protein [Wolbachia endosymbiont (group A) of Pogonocherus hispidulus]|uniref:ankyrin repeat domain-containing protein n=1 Tax=Wolbachia endosymbiont (group A) of Pogonocherus hispidulus TaxID=3066136 RepID=UPI00333E7276
MAIEKEKFFLIIREVSESKDLSSDNVLKKVRDKLKEKSDENGIDSPYTIVYNIFKSHSFYKNHEFKLQMPDSTTARGTLLHFAVQCGNALMVKLLLENKVSATMKDHSGLTPWDIATSNSNQEIVQLLLSANANPQLEKNKDKTPRDIIIKTNKTPEGLVVNGNNAAAAPANVISPYLKQHDATRNDKQTSVTGESSDSTVDEQYQRVNVKSMVKKIESPKKTNATYSNEQTSISLNESSSSDDSGICTESEDGEDIDAKNEELKKLEKELGESKSCIAEHETKLKESNEENESLKQKMQDLGNENTELKDKLDKTESQYSKTEVSLEKVGKRQFSPKVAYASLAAMLVVGAALSIASGLSALLIVAASVVSALIAGGITYTISKPIAPDTELKGVNIQGSAQHGVCKT